MENTENRTEIIEQVLNLWPWLYGVAMAALLLYAISQYGGA